MNAEERKELDPIEVSLGNGKRITINTGFTLVLGITVILGIGALLERDREQNQNVEVLLATVATKDDVRRIENRQLLTDDKVDTLHIRVGNHDAWSRLRSNEIQRAQERIEKRIDRLDEDRTRYKWDRGELMMKWGLAK